jgi:DNA-binding MarR family transcriptional regulator
MPRIDRNARARLLFHAEALDRRTRLPGQHGGVLKRTGLAVLRALLCYFANVTSGRCDPGYDTLARASGCARSTVAVALGRLEAAGLLTRVRRQAGSVRYSNAYLFPAAETLPGARETAWSDNRTQTTTNLKTNYPRNLSTGAGVRRGRGSAAVWHALYPDVAALTVAEARASALAAYEAIVRNRAARGPRGTPE